MEGGKNKWRKKRRGKKKIRWNKEERKKAKKQLWGRSIRNENSYNEKFSAHACICISISLKFMNINGKCLRIAHLTLDTCIRLSSPDNRCFKGMTCFRLLLLDGMSCVLEVPLSLSRDSREVLILSTSTFGWVNLLSFLILICLHYAESSCRGVKGRLWIRPPLLAYLSFGRIP